MKNKLLIIILLFISLFVIDVNASTRTYDRSDDNLLIPNYIEVTEQNKSNILLTPAVDISEKIYDFADIYSDNDEHSLYIQISNFIEETNLDLAVVTINYNNKHNSSVYADDFYDYNGFGVGNSHSGLLLLIDMDSKKIYVTTTGEAINIYTDERVNNILDNVFSYLIDKEYYKGTSVFINYALSYTKFSPSEKSNYVISESGEITKSRKGILVAGIFAIIVTGVSLLVMASRNKLARVAISSIDYLRKDTLKVVMLTDNFLGSSVTRVKIDNGSSKGGYHHISGGGSSNHISSSGTTHGGGGHRF